MRVLGAWLEGVCWPVEAGDMCTGFLARGGCAGR